MKRSYKNLSKRPAPTKGTLDWREKYLREIDVTQFDNRFDDAPLLEFGNSKIGFKSEHYDAVFVWNLPVVATCPGASSWCLRHCYNADKRMDKFPIDKWWKNLIHYRDDKYNLINKLTETLRQVKGNVAVRIHSSGDFFELEYIDFWSEIILNTPSVKYWAYTRSWVSPSLLVALENLKKLENIQLFASWDNSMPVPPSSWRKSIVYNDNEPLSVSLGLICPEQSGKSPNCATCNYCIKQKKGDVYFILH